MHYIIYYDISALILMSVIAIMFFFIRTIRSQKMTSIGLMIAFTLGATILDLITIYVDRVPGTLPVWLDYTLNSFYLIFVAAIAMVYYSYFYILSKGNQGLRHIDYINILGPFGLETIIIATNRVTNLIFYFDENGYYRHGKMYFILYLASLTYIFLALERSYRCRRVLDRVQKTTIWFFTAVMLIAIAIEAIMPEVMITQLGCAIACMLICFSVESPSDYKEKSVDTFNQKAFIEVFNSTIGSGRKFQILGVKVDGMKNMEDLFGRTTRIHLMEEVGALLKSQAGYKKVFSFSNDIFVIVDNCTEEHWKKIETAIRDRFRLPFQVLETQIALTVGMCKIHCPGKIKSVDEIFAMLGYALRDVENHTDGQTVVAEENLIEKGQRESYVIQAIKNAISKRSFQVYYQPIYSVVDQRYTRAEALVRLQDEILGFISPDEFIPLAEQNGLIIEVGAIIFRKVCQMMSRERLWEKGIERVDVNLSVIQCMHEKLADSLIQTMDAFEVPYKAINFEITETAAVVSKEALKHNMEKLLDKGTNFSMDDYGCGYSNTVSIIDYPFAVIKIDKSMLWSAMKKAQAMQALKHTIAMLSDMGFEIVTEGVETVEMADKLSELGCTLHQGYYYSKPLPEEDFIKSIV